MNKNPFFDPLQSQQNYNSFISNTFTNFTPYYGNNNNTIKNTQTNNNNHYKNQYKQLVQNLYQELKNSPINPSDKNIISCSCNNIKHSLSEHCYFMIDLFLENMKIIQVQEPLRNYLFNKLITESNSSLLSIYDTQNILYQYYILYQNNISYDNSFTNYSQLLQQLPSNIPSNFILNNNNYRIHYNKSQIINEFNSLNNEFKPKSLFDLF